MGAKSRTKGAAAERELAHLLADHLGVALKRKLEQTRDGGYDLEGLPGIALECKRYAKAGSSEKRTWWLQTIKQARASKSIPVLAYRLDRAEWTFVVQLSDLTRGEYDESLTVEMTVGAFAMWVREHVIADAA